MASIGSTVVAENPKLFDVRPFESLSVIGLFLAFLSSSFAQQTCNNRALDFDGVNDYVQVNSPLSGNVPMTIEMWFKSESTSTGVCSSTSLANFRWLVGWDDNGFGLGDCNGSLHIVYTPLCPSGTGLCSSLTPFPIHDGAWHHLAVVKGGGSMRIVIDGELFTNFSEGSYNLSGFLRLGSSGTGTVGKTWDGQIDGFRIWNYTRSDSEVFYSYKCQLTGTEPGLVLSLNMDDGLPEGNNMGLNTVQDNSPSNLDGTLSNFALNGNNSNYVCSGMSYDADCIYDCVGCDTTILPACGMLVATCYGYAPDNQPAAALFDVRYNSAAQNGYDWNDPSLGAGIVSEIIPPNWTTQRMGEVFGIAMDKFSNVYFAATDVYAWDANTVFSIPAGITSYTGPAGAAGIYKAAGTNLNQVSNLITTINSSSINTIGTATLPNTGGTGNGIGNIVYDELRHQLFATNLEDGRIYRINLTTGLVMDAYDPFTGDDGLAGLAPLGERLWGIGLYTDAVGLTSLYFNRERSTTNDSEIWSLDLTASGGFPGTGAAGIFAGGGESLAVTVGNIEAGAIGNQPRVTDIEFSIAGKMLVAERRHPHRAHVYEFEKTGSSWNLLRQLFVGGQVHPSHGQGTNSAGGVDYGYMEQDSNVIYGCDSMIWATGNYMPSLGFPCGGANTDCLYGLEGISATGNSFPQNASSDIYIDLNRNYSLNDKFLSGDVDVFKCCQPSTPTGPLCDVNTCASDSLNFSTGYDHDAGALYPTGSFDAFWTLCESPDNSISVPRPAYVVSPNGAWNTMPNTQWLSAYPQSQFEQNNADPYVFKTCFCVCEDSTVVTIDLDLFADDTARIYLADANGAIIEYLGSAIPTTGGFAFQDSLHVFKTLTLNEGTYCIRVELWNTNSVAMGFDVRGHLLGASLISSKCCNPKSSITGAKFHDLNCNGVWDFFGGGGGLEQEPGVPDWTIQLCDAASGALIATTTTDGLGYYTFYGIPPGDYVVKEVQQADWEMKLPLGGSYTINLDTTEVAGLLNFGNKYTGPLAFRDELDCINVGENAQIAWEGGECDCSVNISLLDCNTGSVVLVLGTGLPNAGTYNWLVSNLPEGQYQINITNCEMDNITSSCFDIYHGIMPSIVCPANITIPTDANGCMNTSYTLPDPVVTAYCPCTQVTGLGLESGYGGPYAKGENTFTANYYDKCGSVSCDVKVTVVDATPPTAICQNGLVVQLGTNCNATITPADVDGGSFDNCPDLIFTLSQSDFDHCGIFPVTLTVVDCGENVDFCTSSVTVLDNTLPAITCPPGITISISDDPNSPATGVATGTDNCDNNLSFSFSDQVSGACPIGQSILRTWTASDDCGNLASCFQVITIDCNSVPEVTFILPDATMPCDAEFCLRIQVEGFENIASFQFSLNWDESLIALNGSSTSGYPGVLPAYGYFDHTATNVLTYYYPYLPGGTAPVTLPDGTEIIEICFKVLADGPLTVPIVFSNNPTTIETIDGNGQTLITNTESSLITIMDCDASERNCGEAAITCFPGFISNNASQPINPTSPVFGIVDVRDRSAASTGTMWAAESGNNIYHPTGAWTYGQLGLVFGLAIDGLDNVYTTATTVYGCEDGANFHPFGPAGAAGIYRIATNDAVSNFITTTTGAFVPNSTQLPNTGSGLGNICYDPDHNQLFVTNFHDGMIYRVSLTTGMVVDRFDPFGSLNNASNDNPAFVELGQRTWGIGYNKLDGRLYFSKWNEDKGRAFANRENEVWSIGINPSSGAFMSSCSGGTCVGAEVLELTMPYHIDTYDNPNSIPTPSYVQYSNPVSDIVFSEKGFMLVAERSMYRDCGDAKRDGQGVTVDGNSSLWPRNVSHNSRVLEFFRPAGTNWELTLGHGASVPPFTVASTSTQPFSNGLNELKFVIGSTTAAANTPGGANSAGGIDYGYNTFPVTGSPTECDDMVWATADYAQCNGANRIYGMVGFDALMGGNSCNSYLIDYDGNPSSSQVKVMQGDVEVFRCLECPPVQPECDSLMVILSDSTFMDSTCCYTIDINNQFSSDLTQICADLTTADWIFNTGTVVALGYNISIATSTQLCIENPTGIPYGYNANVLQFCLAETSDNADDEQAIVFSWFEDECPVTCQDAIITACNPPTDKDSCFLLTNLEADCFGGNAYEYCVSFNVTNNSGFPAYGFILENLPAGFSFGDCGCGGAPYGFSSDEWAFDWLFTPLADGATRTLCVKVISTVPILSPTDLCFNATIEGLTKCCSSPYDFCTTISPCCDPCEAMTVAVQPMFGLQDSCCHSLDFQYGCDYNYFKKIEFDILTPGVVFGSHFLGDAVNWNVCNTPTLTNVCIEPVLPGLGEGFYDNLFNFCLSDINNPSEIPQQLKITFWATGSNGQDSIACDTVLVFDCDYANRPCAFTTEEQVECIPDSMKYRITLTVKNNSIPSFDADGLAFLPISPELTPNPIPLVPPLPNDGSTRTVSFCYTPSVFPDPDGQLILVYRLKDIEGDSCCNGNQVLFDTIMLPPCNPNACTCLGFGQLSFQANSGWTLPVQCNSPVPYQLECPGPSGVFKFGGRLLCSPDSCAEKVEWEILNTIEFPLSSGFVFTNSDGTFNLPDISEDLFPNPGVFHLSLQGHCGGDSCGCVIYFTVPACDSTCCVDFDQFCENVQSAISISVDDANCKATVNIGDLSTCDGIQYINWGDGNQDNGPFSANQMIMHTYAGPNTYIIGLLAEENNELSQPPQFCFEKLLQDTIELTCAPPPCTCGNFIKTYIRNKNTGFSQLLSCNNQTPVAIPCPPSGKPYALTGKLNCVGNCTATGISWNMMAPNGSTVLSGSQPGPYFSIEIPSTAVVQNGTYMLSVQGICNGDTCTCKFNLAFEGCGSNCDCEDLKAQVGAGIYLRNIAGCQKEIHSTARLTECDKVDWTIWKNTQLSPIATGTTTGDAPFVYSFPGSEKYRICMRVTRTEPDGTVCKEERCWGIKVHCGGLPSLSCEEPILSNPGFNVAATPGVLGQEGTSLGWANNGGQPEVVTDESCADPVAMRIRGNYLINDLVGHEAVVVPAGKSLRYQLCIKQESQEIPGGVLVGRISSGTQVGTSCEGECEEMFRIAFCCIDVDSFAVFSGGYTPSFVTGDNLEFTLHVENDFLEDDLESRSVVLLDNICIEAEDNTVNKASEPLLGNNFSIFPNPTSGSFSLRASDHQVLGGELHVVDLWGRTVQQSKLEPGKLEHGFSIATLPSGVYFIKVSEYGLSIWVEKLIKQ